MGLFDHIELLARVNDLIKHKRTGNPKEFAGKLGVSERTLYRIIEELRDRGAIVSYNSERSTYFYENSVEINLKIVIEIGECKMITGGKILSLIVPNLAVDKCKIVFDSYLGDSPNPEMRRSF